MPTVSTVNTMTDMINWLKILCNEPPEKRVDLLKVESISLNPTIKLGKTDILINRAKSIKAFIISWMNLNDVTLPVNF